MLVKNLSDVLVNGLQENVININNDYVDVKFGVEKVGEKKSN